MVNVELQQMDLIAQLEVGSFMAIFNLDLPRTNNALEGWHRAFLQQVSSHHTSIWKFLNALKR